MELVLNLAWVLLAATLICLWIRFAPRRGSSRSLQFAALVALILILFPVISVTDDLQAALNPAEIDCCQRKDDACSHPHPLVPVIAALPVPILAPLPTSAVGVLIPRYLAAPSVEIPALASIQNRPPPAA